MSLNAAKRSFLILILSAIVTCAGITCKKDIYEKVADATRIQKPVQSISFNDFLRKVNISRLGTLKSSFDVRGSVRQMSLNIPEVYQGLNILTDSIKTFSVNEKTSYVFPIQLSSSRSIAFQNLTIQIERNQTKAFISTYYPTKKWISDWKADSAKNFEGEVLFTPIDLNEGQSNSLVIKGEANTRYATKWGSERLDYIVTECVEYQIYVQVWLPCTIDNHYDITQCEIYWHPELHPGASPPRYGLQLQSRVQCTTFDDGQGSSQNPPGSGGGNGNTGGGTTPNPPPSYDPCDGNGGPGGGGGGIASIKLTLLMSNGRLMPVPPPDCDPNGGGNNGGNNQYPYTEQIRDAYSANWESDTEIYEDPDPTNYPEYQQNQAWPTINSVMSPDKWIPMRWRADGSQENCLKLAREMLASMGFKCSGYSLSSGQVFQTYTESGGVNQSATKKAVSYIISALSNKIPVLVGVDNRVGVPSLANVDMSTDHFVVIVGMGIENGQKYFLFYDSSTTSRWQGASPANKLFYNETTGAITGKTSSGYGSLPGAYDYKVTQVRKSISDAIQ